MFSYFSRDPLKGFQYELGEKLTGVDEDCSIWEHYKGKHKTTLQEVSVFVCNLENNSDTIKQIAQAAAKRLRTLRHPNVVSFIDSLETDKGVYVVTEPVTPLEVHLKLTESTNEVETSWGLHQIVKGLSFLLNNVNLIHNNVCMSSMFVDNAGEWKLAGVDYMFPASGEGSNYPPLKPLPALEKYDPPEKSSKSRKSEKWSADMWGLGCLIWEVFNGKLPRTSSLKVTSKIPKKLVKCYCELMSANPTSRPSPDQFLEKCKSMNGFMNNHYVQTNLFLEEIQIKEAHEQASFFNDLTAHVDEFPKAYSRHKILPQLLNVFQYGNAGPSVLPPLFKLGTLLDEAEYQTQIVPCVIKLFGSTDRATRIHLLRQLHLFVEHLKPQVVNTQVFQNMLTGFMDTNPAIREQTVKGMLMLAPKLNSNNLNVELMKHFARLQARDEQGPIRTNTTVCLGKIIQHLNPVTRQKVISSAFARATKDPFPAARIAGVIAMSNNMKYYTTQDCAFKVLPTIAPLCCDPDKQVRDHVFKSIQAFVDRLKDASDNPEKAAQNDEAVKQDLTSPSVTQQAAGWAGWMTTGVTTLTSKYIGGKAGQPQPKEGDNATATKETPVSSEGKSPTPQPEKSKEVQEEEKEENNDEGDGWDDNDDEWDSLEMEPTKPAPSSKKPSGRKLVTSSQLRSMEDDIWQNLHMNEEVDKPATPEPQQQQVVKQNNFDDWGDTGWGDDDVTNEPAQQTGDDWGNDWNDDNNDDGGWDVKPTATTAKTKTANSKAIKKAATPSLPTASSYDWGGNNNQQQEDFFNDFSANKKQTKLQPTKKKIQPKSASRPASASPKPSASVSPQPPVATDNNWGDDDGWGADDGWGSTPPATTVVKKPVQKKATTTKPNDDWGGGGWDDNNWGDDFGDDSGMTEAERKKKEREEKRKLRQKQIEEKRANKQKLGARKCD